MTRKERQIEFNRKYKEVISLVESGMNIRHALDKLGIDSGTFYRNANDKQKNYLKGLKSTKCYKYLEWQTKDDFSELDF
jgi:hypothetical protein